MEKSSFSEVMRASGIQSSEKFWDALNKESGVNEAQSLEGLNVEENAPTFDEHDLQAYNAEKKELTAEEIENKKRFVKSLSPEYKAEMVFANMQRQEGARLIVGHEKRIYMRKLIREAKKGKLDKYFL